MSDTTADVTANEEPAQEPLKPETDWKARSREWEAKAKANKDAADRLAALEEANKSEAQKAAERLAEAERRAVEAEARVLRREIALEHSLSREDAALLDAITDEDAMRALAERLSRQVEDNSKPGAYVPAEGGRPAALALNGDGLEDALRRKLGIR